MFVHRLARPMLAAVFVISGINTLRNPDKNVKAATPLITTAVEKFGDSLPEQVPTDPATVVRLDAALKVAAGVGLAMGWFPRLSAFVLAVNLVPTTVAGHAFWEHEDPVTRNAQRSHFLKNVALVGGLLAAAAEPRRRKAQREA
jgi:putative oxidoreductase